MAEITFTTTDDQQMLRDTATKFLADKATSTRVRELMATDAGFDEAEWAESTGMGWLSLAIPEELGGIGYGWTEVAVLAEEMGRTLWCAPWLSAAVLAPATLLGARGEATDALLRSIAAGEVRATVAHRLESTEVDLDGGTVSGEARFVLDATTADTIVVLANGPEGSTLVAVDTSAEGVRTTRLPELDLTRRLGEVSFTDAPATVLATGAQAEAAFGHGVLVAAAILANEQVGGAARVLAESVEYGRTRMQFGRAIGSYQALKHRMADTLKEVEAAKSAAYHAARAVDGDDADEAVIATAMAVSYCGEVYERAAGHNIQNHGGIGFTWEADAHLFFKRAKASKLLFGSASAWRDRLGSLIGV